MAFSFSPLQGSGRRRRMGTLSDINVIPLVDVVLVLLIIFILTAHVMEFGLEIDVPTVRQVQTTLEELPVVNVTREGNLHLNEDPVNINMLGSEIRSRFAGAKEVYVRADKAVVWEALAQVISELNEARLVVKMVTQPLDGNPGDNSGR